QQFAEPSEFAGAKWCPRRFILSGDRPSALACRQYLRTDTCYRRTIRYLVFSRGSQWLDARFGTRAGEEKRSHSGCDALSFGRKEPDEVFRGNITIPQAMIDEIDRRTQVPPDHFGKCPLLAQSGHRCRIAKCPLLTHSGHLGVRHDRSRRASFIQVDAL